MPYHYFNNGLDDEEPFVMPKVNVFEKAVELLLPDLSKNDPRFAAVVDYARRDFRRGGKHVTVLANVEGAESLSLVKVSSFFRKLDLDPGKREVVVSGHNILFTRDYKVAPVPVR